MPDTPCKSQPASDTSDLGAKRIHISFASSIDKIPECPLEYIFQSLLPALPPGGPSLQFIKQALGIGSNWTQTYNSTQPAQSLFKEDETFEKLAILFNDVNRVCNQDRTSILRVVNTPSNPPRLEPGSKHSHSTYPDACLVLVDSKSVLADITLDAPPWSDIVIPWEYKKRDNSIVVKDNFYKIIRNMSQIMTFDPCRRFSYGLTVENAGLRVWFCDRSGYIVSESINHSDPDRLIGVFARLSLASEEGLGYDRSITRVLRNGTAQYHIRLDTPNGARVFKTKRPLDDLGADRALGRATRVWEVYEGDDDTKTHALKDVWVEESRLREGDNYAAILEGTTDEERRHFLTVLCHGDAKLSGGQVDTTLGIRRYQPPSNTFPNVDMIARSYSQSITLEDLDRGPRAPERRRPFSSRAHYRIVFKEVGIPLPALRNMEAIWTTICDANMGLVIMQNRGWIHRDISARNILVYEQSGKLSDLEFAVRYAPNVDLKDSHVHLAGTKDFVSAELFARRYLYWRWSGEIQQYDDSDDFVQDEPRNLPNFLQNFCHDAESLWWVALWTIARLQPVNCPLNEILPQYRAMQYLEWFPELPRTVGNAFDVGLAVFVGADPLSRTHMPQAYHPIFSALKRWRKKAWHHIGLTQPGSKHFTASGMDGLHQGVQDVISMQENLAYMRKIGDLELLDGFV